MSQGASPRTAVILQSSYIPWKGYFDLMNVADVFVLFDEVQYTRRDWRNRNKLILSGAPKWLTIPVESKGNYTSAIHDIRISDPDWAAHHWRSIRHAYGKAPCFDWCGHALQDAYAEAASLSRLSEINQHFLERLAPLLGVETEFCDSSAIDRRSADPTDRLVEICESLGATRYVSGPAARSYIKAEAFERAGVALDYANYAGYPAYPQAAPSFEHGVSVIDLLMNVGEDARRHLKSNQPDGLTEPA